MIKYSVSITLLLFLVFSAFAQNTQLQQADLALRGLT